MKLLEKSMAGRLRGKNPGWAVLLFTERKGFGRTIQAEHAFTKLDSERFWEDPNGWYIDPTCELAMACEAAVKKFSPWEATQGGAGE